MSRKRFIDISIYFDSELHEALGDRGLHLYICLWCIAEDSGVYVPDYARIALRMGALCFTPDETKNFIDSLIGMKKIIPYTVNGRTYHWIKNFFKYQPVNNPTIPRLPLPEWLFVDIHIYKSRKKCAKFAIIHENLPSGYSVWPSCRPQYRKSAGSLPEIGPHQTESIRNRDEEIARSYDFTVDPRTGKITAYSQKSIARLKKMGYSQ